MINWISFELCGCATTSPKNKSRWSRSTSLWTSYALYHLMRDIKLCVCLCFAEGRRWVWQSRRYRGVCGCWWGNCVCQIHSHTGKCGAACERKATPSSVHLGREMVVAEWLQSVWAIQMTLMSCYFYFLFYLFFARISAAIEYLKLNLTKLTHLGCGLNLFCSSLKSSSTLYLLYVR